jgi:aminoglycoside 6'-N-acetyltransferase
VANAGPSLSFRPLRRADFSLLGRWLAEPLVTRWWNHETTPAALERDFGPTVDGREPGEAFIVLAADRPFGYSQRYPIAAYPEYAAELAAVCEVPPGALSVDYFIGVPGLRGRGLGAAMIAAFVADGWSRYPSAADVIVPVAAGNVGSWRALERAGFRRIAAGELEPDNPRDPRDHYVYRRQRPQ